MGKGLESKNRITNHLANGLRLIPKDLYNKILEDMIPGEIIDLFYHVGNYNSLYFGIKEVAPELLKGMTEVDKNLIIKKSLETKNTFLINRLLLFAPEYQTDAFEFLKNSNDDKFMYEFIREVRFDWNPYFDFLKGLKHLDEDILWKSVVKENQLNAKNMLMLLEGENWYVLKIMYYMNNIEKNWDLSREKVSYYFMLNSEKIKKIDEEFYDKIVKRWISHYEELIDYVIKRYKSSTKENDAQISFYDLNSGSTIDNTDQSKSSLAEGQKCRTSSIINIINGRKRLSDYVRPILNTYLLVNKEEVKKVNFSFYEARIKPLIELDTAKLIDIISKDYMDIILNEGEQGKVTQIRFDDYISKKEPSGFLKK